MKKGRGFTLIELLVVIAIIGILSAVVLASLNTAKNKGSDAAIQSDLSGLQTEAEIYYGTTGSNSYGGSDSTGSCTLNGTMFDTNSAHANYDGTIVKAIAGAKSASGNGAIVCSVSGGGGAYAVSSALVNGVTVGGTTYGYWCVDSTGSAKPESTNIIGGTNYSCP